MNTQKIERGSGATNSKASNQKIYVNAGAIIKPFDVSYYRKTTTKTQVECAICNPRPHPTPQGTVKLCSECAATQNRLETDLLEGLSTPRKVIRLHKCAGCQRCVTPTRFSRDWGICKSCVSDARNKSKLARSNFIERTLNNFRKTLNRGLHNA